MRSELQSINAKAHINTVHPNGLCWPDEISNDELDFISLVVFDVPDQHQKAIAYITKELAQLAEIERHVSAVMALIMAELQGDKHPLSDGFELHDALSCFAAEETHHSNMFYRYVRLLSGRDVKYPNNLFSQRVELYQGNDSPYVKLAALCSSAYIGESVMTVFEHRLLDLDPKMRFFITQLISAHGLDEARHIETDHFVFDHVIPSLSDREKQRMRWILESTEALNMELAMGFEAFTKETFNVNFTENNLAYQTQLKLIGSFRNLVFGGEAIRKVDEVITEADRQILLDFTSTSLVHT